MQLIGAAPSTYWHSSPLSLLHWSEQLTPFKPHSRPAEPLLDGQFVPPPPQLQHPPARKKYLENARLELSADATAMTQRIPPSAIVFSVIFDFILWFIYWLWFCCF
jgi:hypothetical protein